MHDLAFDLEFSELEQLADDTIQVNLISEKRVFQPPTKAEQFAPKFHRLVLGLVELNNVNGINGRQAAWRKSKKGLKLLFLCF